MNLFVSSLIVVLVFFGDHFRDLTLETDYFKSIGDTSTLFGPKCILHNV